LLFILREIAGRYTSGGDWLWTMEKVAIGQLELLDLRGRSVDLQDYLGKYSLLIFLRHLA
jgi:hypothetical protein